jgi:hypothetical protein
MPSVVVVALKMPSLCTFIFKLLLGTLLLLTLDVGALVMPGAFPT